MFDPRGSARGVNCDRRSHVRLWTLHLQSCKVFPLVLAQVLGEGGRVGVHHKRALDLPRQLRRHRRLVVDHHVRQRGDVPVNTKV